MATEPKSEAALIRALSEDLALEILASYTPEAFADADFTSLGEAAVYLAQHEPGVGPALQDLIDGAKWWIGYCGESASFTELTRLLPDLELRTEEGNVRLGGPRLGKLNEATLREDLAWFTGFANTLLALSNSRAGPIALQG